MLLITGANGRLGSAIVNQISKDLNNHQFIVSSSSQNGIEKLSKKGFNARLANFDNIETLNKAFEGVDKLVLISTMDQNRFQQHKNVIDSAINSGVKHIYYTSLSIKNIENSYTRDLMISHFETEDYLKQSGINYTIFRNTMYAEALKELLLFDHDTNTVKSPAGIGKIPFATIKELGECIAKSVLRNDNPNEIINLTGSEFYTIPEIIDIINNIKSTDYKYIDVSVDEYSNYLKSKSFNEFLIYLHTSTLSDVNNKQYEIKEDQLENLIGRKSASAETFLIDIFK